MTEQPTHRLDISGEVCPMTFVRTRLLLERMQPGEIAEIILREGEPLENVPRAVQDLGFRVLLIAPADRAGLHRLLVQV
ncbi:MAG: sulfurtransferase TusA family protein [Alphaproteobacteria bacterium]|nr:sulfurtransferase TusA family protein [Alphaproteobacteria bacterium]